MPQHPRKRRLAGAGPGKGAALGPGGEPTYEDAHPSWQARDAFRPCPEQPCKLDPNVPLQAARRRRALERKTIRKSLKMAPAPVLCPTTAAVMDGTK